MMSPETAAHDWDTYLVNFRVAEILILEQVYLVEDGPVTLSVLQRRLLYLNLCGRTVSRYVERLTKRGLLVTVKSGDTFVNPILAVAENVSKLVRLWRLREERAVKAYMPTPSSEDRKEVV